MAAWQRWRDPLLTLVALVALAGGLHWLGGHGSFRLQEAFALFAIWAIAAVSLNLINGVTGILSLGQHGFMLIGGYATALLILPETAREVMATSARSQMTPFTLSLSLPRAFDALGLHALAAPDMLWVSFVVALLIGGLLASLAGLVVGIPSLRLRGDYLAIATFAFGEIIRLLASTPVLAPLTNGALGFSGVPSQFGKSLWWTFGALAITVYIMARLKQSSYGRALQAIREDEIAAEAMGINLAHYKVLAFSIAAFFAGAAGALYVSWFATARLDLFLFTLTFFFLVAISVGGNGSITGSLLGTALVVFIRQYGDPIEEAYRVSAWIVTVGVLLVAAALGVLAYRRQHHYRGSPVVLYLLALAGVACLVVGLVAPHVHLMQGLWRGFGLRAILLSVLLVAIMVFRPAGIFGTSEFTWGRLFGERKDQPTEEERRQDAWLTNPELNPEAAPVRLPGRDAAEQR